MPTLLDDSLIVGSDVIFRFLNLLRKDPRKTYFRAFGHEKGVGDKTRGFGGALHRWVKEKMNIYAVINNGGQRKADIFSCPAIWCEYDNIPRSLQRSEWTRRGLPIPTFKVDTGNKSIHSYWVLSEDISPERWERLQKALILRMESDPSIKDLPRVMRVPGTPYIGKGGTAFGRVELIDEAGSTYSPEDLETNLLEELLTVDAEAERAIQEFQGPATEGQRLRLPAQQETPDGSVDLEPRSMDDIRAALQLIPVRSPGSYELHRNALWGLMGAVREAGGTDAEAVGLMEAHSPSSEYGWNIPQVARSGNGSVTAGTFWKIAADHGYDLSRPAPQGPTRIALNEGGGGLTGEGGDKDGGECGVTGEPGNQKRKGPRPIPPHEALEELPKRIGHLRHNVRTDNFHAADLPTPAISKDDAARLYLTLSSQDEKWSKDSTYDAIHLLAMQDPYDPVADYLKRCAANTEPLDWGDWERLDSVLLNIDDPIAAAFLPRYLVGAVARVFKPGCKMDQMPVLVGKQGILKGTLGRALFGDGFYGEGVSHRFDVDDVTRLERVWALELSELDGITKRSDQEALKSFITRVSDFERRKYARATEEIPRRSVFWATSNTPPLRDMTGSRRFVCIPLTDAPLPVADVTRLRDQIWSRAYQQFNEGMQWFSTPEEMEAITDRNLDFEEVDPWQAPVVEYLDRSAGMANVSINALLAHLGVPTERQNTLAAKKARTIAEAAGWAYKRAALAGGRRSYRLFPPGK